jgi:hypothetical protein
MDKESEAELARIVKKDIASLIEEDKQFLVGRREHLNELELKKFASVIEAQLAANQTKDEAPAEPKKK